MPLMTSLMPKSLMLPRQQPHILIPPLPKHQLQWHSKYAPMILLMILHQPRVTAASQCSLQSSTGIDQQTECLSTLCKSVDLTVLQKTILHDMQELSLLTSKQAVLPMKHKRYICSQPHDKQQFTLACTQYTLIDLNISHLSNNLLTVPQPTWKLVGLEAIQGNIAFRQINLQAMLDCLTAPDSFKNPVSISSDTKQMIPDKEAISPLTITASVAHQLQPITDSLASLLQELDHMHGSWTI